MSEIQTPSISSKQSNPVCIDEFLPLTGTKRITQFHCPCCINNPLEVMKLANAEICGCSKCLGIVIDNDTCGGLISALRMSYDGPDVMPQPLSQEQLRASKNCPACGDKMEVHPYYGPGNAVIDSCMHCKLSWFDAGELEQIIRSPGLRQPSNVSTNRASDLASGRSEDLANNCANNRADNRAKTADSQSEQFHEIVTDITSWLLKLLR